MNKKCREPTHVGTSHQTGRYHGESAQLKVVYLHETKTQWCEFGKTQRWRKSDGRGVGDSKWGPWRSIKDVHPITKDELIQYYEEFVQDAAAKMQVKEGRILERVSQRDRIIEQISDLQQEKSDLAETIQQAEICLAKLAGMNQDEIILADLHHTRWSNCTELTSTLVMEIYNEATHTGDLALALKCERWFLERRNHAESQE